ncbi:MAG: ABC transporter permease [Candidatus Wallbacteria bacterium]|nr:ABC transporter permease [Candidatus Wallbacteria bacterium]
MRNSNRLKLFLAMLPMLLVLSVGFGGAFFVKDPLKLNFRERSNPPSAQHYFGTDDIGCDLLKKITLATRVTVMISLCAVLLSLSAGLILGSFCGYFPGSWCDYLINAFSDILLSFPNFFLILIMVAVLGNNVSNLVAVIAVGYFPTVFRMVRSEVMALKQSDFVLAARSFGSGWWHNFSRHVLSNIRENLVAVFLVGMGTAIVAESALSFLGLGVPLEKPSLGSLLASGRNYLNAWWLSFFPGLFIFMLNFSLQMLGELYLKRERS